MKLKLEDQYFQILFVLPILLVNLTASAAPKADLWEYWRQSNPQSPQSIDHGTWQDFLSKYLHTSSDGVNRLDYRSVKSEDKLVLKQYIGELSNKLITKYHRDEQLPYWINLYNALTVDIVLDHYPVKSIRKIKNGFLSFGPWGKKRLIIEERELSLDDIEHRILRPIWKDPRIHYSVNCASIGCPNLRRGAFTRISVDKDLTNAAMEYVNHPRGASVVNGRLIVSSIYKWFRSDFGGNDREIIEHLRQYAKLSLIGDLKTITEIDDDQYDWTLNDVTPNQNK